MAVYIFIISISDGSFTPQNQSVLATRIGQRTNARPRHCLQLRRCRRSSFVCTQVTQVKTKAKLNIEEVGNNLLCLIKYYVYPGREAEALKYLQDGFDQTISKEMMSPLQFVTRRHPDDEIESDIYSEPGAICVRYRFPFD